MITALHTIVYAQDAQLAREFFRDVLQFPYVDTGGGWLIFKTGPSELASHPNSWEWEGKQGGTDESHELSFICDDLALTMADLAARGAEFEGEVAEQPWGLATSYAAAPITATPYDVADQRHTSPMR